MKEADNINSIAISGKGGTGKTTLAEAMYYLINNYYPELGWGEPFEAGQVFRANRVRENNPDLSATVANIDEHEEIDRQTLEILEKGGIAEGRNTAIVANEYELKNVTKVMMVADDFVRWHRISDRDSVDIDTVREKETRREDNNSRHFSTLYGRDFNDPKEYDAFLNTGEMSIPESIAMLGLISGVISFFDDVVEVLGQVPELMGYVEGKDQFSLSDRFEIFTSGDNNLAAAAEADVDSVAFVMGGIIDNESGLMSINQDELITIVVRR